MPSLVEAAASAAVGGAVLALVTASLGSSARIDAEAARLSDDLYRTRQLEHLVDRAALPAGGGPKRPAALSSIGSSAAVFGSDLDGSGAVDTDSSETTALEVSQDGSTARIRVKLGRQAMTVMEAERSDARIVALDAGGRTATASAASLVELQIVPRDGGAIRAMRFAIPSRFLP